jgi:dTDP-4-amino-4,6-dideoxygalactose transaminase
MEIPLLDLKLQYKSIQDEVRHALDRICERQDFILGTEVDLFERDLAKYIKVKYGIGVASGSDALLIALMVLGIGRNDEVITTPYTFFATVGAIWRVGARPIFVDIEPDTYNLNPDLIKRVITSKTKAILPVHLFGLCANMCKINNLAEQFGLKIIEDAAQALGAQYLFDPSTPQAFHYAGTMGDLGCFSFFPSKNLGCFGDGGMIVTNNQEFAQLARSLRVHGSNAKYYHPMVGINSRLDALQATVLRTKLNYLELWTQKRQDNAQFYNARLKNVGDITLPCYNNKESIHVYNQYVLRTQKRDGLRKYLADKGISTAIYYPLPLHLQECFKDLGYKRGDFPEAEKASLETLSLPVYPELSLEQKEYIISCIKDYYNKT